MKKHFLTLASSITLISLCGGLVWAAQLEGLQISPKGDKVEVILDMPQEQGYQVERSADNQYSIVLPKTKLPAAFQGTGLPAIKHSGTGMTAEVHEAGDTVRIELKGLKNGQIPCEVRFKTPIQPPLPQPKSPLALTKPDKEEIEGLFSKLKQGFTAKKAAQTEWIAPSAQAPLVEAVAHLKRPSILKAHRHRVALVAKAPAPRLYRAPQAQARPKPAIIAQKPIITEEEALQLQPKVAPAEAPIKVAEAEKQPEGFNLMEQAVEEEQVEAPPAPEAETYRPSVTNEIAPVPYREGQFGVQKHAKRQMKGLFSGTLMRWVFVSIALVGGLILLAAAFLVMAQRRKAKARDFLAQPAPGTEYFEEPLPTVVPEPETYEELMAGERVKPQSRKPMAPQARKLVQPVEVLQPERPKAALKPAPRPVQAKQAAQPVASTEDLLIHPASSMSEAVRNSLGSKSNPYLTTPFKIAPKAPLTQGGPGRRPRPNSAPTRGTRSGSVFSQHLQSP